MRSERSRPQRSFIVQTRFFLLLLVSSTVVWLRHIFLREDCIYVRCSSGDSSEGITRCQRSVLCSKGILEQRGILGEIEIGESEGRGIGGNGINVDGRSGIDGRDIIDGKKDAGGIVETNGSNDQKIEEHINSEHRKNIDPSKNGSPSTEIPTAKTISPASKSTSETRSPKTNPPTTSSPPSPVVKTDAPVVSSNGKPDSPTRISSTSHPSTSSIAPTTSQPQSKISHPPSVVPNKTPRFPNLRNTILSRTPEFPDGHPGCVGCTVNRIVLNATDLAAREPTGTPVERPETLLWEMEDVCLVRYPGVAGGQIMVHSIKDMENMENIFEKVVETDANVNANVDKTDANMDEENVHIPIADSRHLLLPTWGKVKYQVAEIYVGLNEKLIKNPSFWEMPTVLQFSKTAAKRPTFFVTIEWWGHLWHTMVDLFAPLHATKGLLYGYETDVNLIVIFNQSSMKSQGYFRKLALGLTELGRDLGIWLHFLDVGAEHPSPNVFPAGRMCFRSSGLEGDGSGGEVDGRREADGGRRANKRSKTGPVVLGFGYEFKVGTTSEWSGSPLGEMGSPEERKKRIEEYWSPVSWRPELAELLDDFRADMYFLALKASRGWWERMTHAAQHVVGQHVGATSVAAGKGGKVTPVMVLDRLLGGGDAKDGEDKLEYSIQELVPELSEKLSEDVVRDPKEEEEILPAVFIVRDPKDLGGAFMLGDARNIKNQKELLRYPFDHPEILKFEIPVDGSSPANDNADENLLPKAKDNGDVDDTTRTLSEKQLEKNEATTSKSTTISSSSSSSKKTRKIRLQLRFPILEKLTFPEGARVLFSHTAILMGVHGAGLGNLFFLPPGAGMTEIVCSECRWPANPEGQKQRQPLRTFSHADTLLRNPHMHYTLQHTSVVAKQMPKESPNAILRNIFPGGVPAGLAGSLAGGGGGGGGGSSQPREEFHPATLHIPDVGHFWKLWRKFVEREVLPGLVRTAVERRERMKQRMEREKESNGGVDAVVSNGSGVDENGVNENDEFVSGLPTLIPVLENISELSQGTQRIHDIHEHDQSDRAKNSVICPTIENCPRKPVVCHALAAPEDEDLHCFQPLGYNSKKDTEAFWDWSMVEIPYKKQDLAREKERLAGGNQGGKNGVKEGNVVSTGGGSSSSQAGRYGMGMARAGGKMERGDFAIGGGGGGKAGEKEEVLWVAETLSP